MRPSRNTLALLFLFLATQVAFVCPAAADWRSDLDALLDDDDPGSREALLGAVLGARPGCEALAEAIRTRPYPEPPLRGDAQLDSIFCEDGALRPFVTYVPKSYNPAEPMPLFVWLHGGVGRGELYGDPLGYAREHEIREWAESEGWLLLFPFGQAGAVWWDEVGMANVDAQLRLLKRRFNVDDDRVWLGGFSDGASAAWLFAMTKPDDYAAFVALNGHMGIGSLSGELPTYAPNLRHTPVWAVHTDRDGLYPARKMAPTVAMAIEAGGDIDYRVVEGFGHDLDYAPEQFPLLAQWLGEQRRERFPRRIRWESGATEFGSCRWLRIDRVLPEAPARWHGDWNHTLVSDRVSIGFHHDDAFEGSGVRVARLADGETAAKEIGLQAGDVVVAGGDFPIDGMDDLGAWKRGLARGDEFSLTVVREGERRTLAGRLPEPELYNLFKREVPSAVIRASRRGNRVQVSGSRLGAFTLRVHPELFDLNRPITVRRGGRILFHGRVEPDPEYMLRGYLRERDRRLLYVGEIAVDLAVER